MILCVLYHLCDVSLYNYIFYLKKHITDDSKITENLKYIDQRGGLQALIQDVCTWCNYSPWEIIYLLRVMSRVLNIDSTRQQMMN